MANNEVPLFEVPAEESQVVPPVESNPEQPQMQEQVQQEEALPDLRGLGLLDYEKQLADSAEASSPDQGTQEQVSDTPGQESATPEAKEDPARLQYWQSKADKAEAAYNKMAELAPNAVKYAPIIEAIQKDPEVLDFISNKMNNGTLGQAGAGAPQTGTTTPAPQRASGPPVKPQRPSSYDPAAAIHEAESESYKYREAMEHYRDEMDDWRNNQEQVRYQQMQQAQQQQMQQSAIANNYNTLKHEYGATDADIQAYNSWLNNPATMNIHNLWKFHQYMNQPETNKKITKQKVSADMNQAKRVKQIPTTPTKVAGGTSQNLSEADKFNLDLLMTNKKR